jgi:2-(1,2-epoxy-1,2-dihydrophenyl)acetyl-CoA isomerase
MADDHAILFERQDDLGMLTLNRPQARNSLRLDDVRLLGERLTEAMSSGVRCLMLSGAGDAFCAGRDLKETDPENDDTRAILRDVINPVLLSLYDLPLPTIAVVKGPALGLGFGLALACDLTLAAENAVLGSPFRNIGCVLDSGGHYFMERRIGRHRAAELIFTGRLISGREAAQLGLINRAIGALALDAEAEALAREIATGPTAAFRASKRILNNDAGMSNVLDLEAAAQAEALASRDGREGIRAFQEKRKPRFTGA